MRRRERQGAVARGRITQPMGRHLNLALMLMEHYDGNAKFVADKHSLAARYGRLLRALDGRMHNHPGDLACWAAEPDESHDPYCAVCGISVGQDEQYPIVAEDDVPSSEGDNVEPACITCSGPQDSGEFVRHHVLGPSQHARNTVLMCTRCHRAFATGQYYDGVSWSVFPIPVRPGQGLPSLAVGDRLLRDRHLWRYRSEVVSLCRRWGLHCHWAPTRMHRALMALVFRFVERIAPSDSPASSQSRSHLIQVEAEYQPLSADNWAETEKTLLEEARRNRDEIRRQYAEVGYILQDSEPALARHVRWLYLRICPQEGVGRPLGWSAIVRYKDWDIEWLTPSGVQKAVDPLAAELGIILPPLKAGRPRAFA